MAHEATSIPGASGATGIRTNGAAGKGGEAGFSGRRLDALLDILPVGVFTIGPDMRIRIMNGEAARLTGIDPRSAVSSPLKVAQRRRY